MSVGLTAPIVGIGVAAIKLASDLAENMNKVDVAFGKNSKEVKSWSDTTLKSFGISKGSALEMASLFGDMGTAMGQSTSEASKMSTGMVGLAGDLASFKNIGIDQASDALKGIFTGEGESLKSLGIIMQDSTLKAFALATGQKKSYSEMSQAEKVALRYAFVMDATKNTQGDFARTSEGTANQTRIFGETMKELGENMGKYILPVVTPLIAKLSELAQSFGKLDEGTKKTIIVIAGIVAIIGPLLIVSGTLITAVGTIATAFGIVSTAIAAAGGVMAIVTSPIFLVIAALVLLGLGIYAIVKHWDVIKAKTAEVWASIKSGVSSAVSGIKTAIVNGFNSAISFITGLPGRAVGWGRDFIQGLINGITTMVGSVVNAVSGIASKITSFLHFSVPDEGPLADYESWMPDFMGGMAKGIEANKYKVIDSIKGLTGNMKVNANITPGIGGAQKVISGGAPNVQNINITMPGMVIREEADIQKISEGLGFLVNQAGRAVGQSFSY